MIRHSPADQYIKGLVLKGYRSGPLVQVLAGLNLDYPGPAYIRRVRKELLSKLPEPFRLRTYAKHRPTRDFLIRQGVYEMFQSPPEMELAFVILEKPRAKEFIETLLIAHAPTHAIAYRLANMHHVRGCSTRVVDLYKKYFFNVDLLDSSEVKAVLQLRIDNLLVMQSKSGEEARQGLALKKAYYSDPRKVAADMPHSPFSALVAQLQMGILPDTMDLKKLAETSAMLAQIRLFEAMAATPHEFDKRALNLAQTARILQEIQEAKIRPEEELRNQLEAVKLKTSQTALPLLAELTGGAHTVDLVATPTSSGGSDDSPGK